MAWQTVSRKGGGKGWNQGMENQLLQSMTAMQNSISQLAQSIQTRPPPGRKGQGKGNTPKGQGKGTSSSPGERKNPNLKPLSERAERTTEEVKCPVCPNTYNWTTRQLCRSCGHKLPQGNTHRTSTPQPSPGQASAKSGAPSSSSVVSSGASFAAVVKGETGQAGAAKEEKTTQQKKADSLEKFLSTMPDDDPLREDFQTQLDQLRAALKDPRHPGARLDSATAKLKKAEAKVTKMEEQLRQAEEALASARAEKEQASSELKAAQENAVPTKQLEHPPGDAGMQLSSEDITDLTDMLKQCGLLAVAAAEEAGETPSKKARAGPYSNPKKSPREIAKLANPALIARLASSVHFLEEAVKSGGDGSLEDTIPGDPEALREPLAPPPANPKDTVKDTETPPDVQMNGDGATPK